METIQAQQFINQLSLKSAEMTTVVMPFSTGEKGIDANKLTPKQTETYAEELNKLTQLMFSNSLLFDQTKLGEYFTQNDIVDLTNAAIAGLVHEQTESLTKSSQGFQFNLASNEVTPSAQWGGYIFHAFQNLVALPEVQDVINPDLKEVMGVDYYPDIVADIGTIIINSNPELFPNFASNLGSTRGSLYWEYFLPNPWSYRAPTKDKQNSARKNARYIYDLLSGFENADELRSNFLGMYIQQRAINTAVRRMNVEPNELSEYGITIWQKQLESETTVQIVRVDSLRSKKDETGNFVGTSVFWNDSHKHEQTWEAVAVYGPGYHVKKAGDELDYFEAANTFPTIDPNNLNLEIIGQTAQITYTDADSVIQTFTEVDGHINVNGTVFKVTRPGEIHTVINSSIVPNQGFRGDVWFLSLKKSMGEGDDFVPAPIL